WDGPRELMKIPPASPKSYEYLAHATGIPSFALALREPRREELSAILAAPRLERAIGVIYRPDHEQTTCYFQAKLAAQFDEYIWIDETHALSPLQEVQVTGVPETYP